eukprot:COSAG05_NODE_10083_length_584_cov_0.531959_1_plen_83_part_01
MFLQQIKYSGAGQFCCATSHGRLAIFRNTQTVEGVGTKSIDYCWGMEEKTVGFVQYDEKLRYLAAMPAEAATIRVWHLDPARA